MFFNYFKSKLLLYKRYTIDIMTNVFFRGIFTKKRGKIWIQMSGKERIMLNTKMTQDHLNIKRYEALLTKQGLSFVCSYKIMQLIILCQSDSKFLFGEHCHRYEANRLSYLRDRRFFLFIVSRWCKNIKIFTERK